MAKVDPGNLLADTWTSYEAFEKLLCRMEELTDEAEPLRRDLYRLVHPKWSGEGDRLSGQGAKQFGGRWNPAGLAAVYGSVTAIGAAHESFGQAERYGWRAEQMTPRIIFAFHADLKAVLDLTAGPIRQRLRVSRDRLLGCDWERSRCKEHVEQLTQAVGRTAAAAGLEGLIVPSAESDAANVVIFPDFLRRASKLAAINADEIGD